MYLILCPFDIRVLERREVTISKIVFLHVYGDYIEHIRDKRPEHVKADSEVRPYRRCDEYYNQPWQGTHMNGSAPKIKDCSECRAVIC